MDKDENNVKRVFDENCSHLKFDAKLAKKFSNYVIEFINKNEDSMTFFGSGLMGVQIVRFTAQDKEKWFTDVIETDDIILEEKLLDLPKINQEFHVSSDLFNLSAVWVIHRFMNSPLLNDKQKDQAMLDTAMALNIKYLTSLLYQYFKYPADPQIAAAAYAQLSYKYAIKQYGNWFATLQARCNDFLHNESIHHQTLKKFNDDGKIVYMLNDTQGRIRDMVKNLFGELVKVKNQGLKIKSTSTLSLDNEGEQIVKDKTKNLLGYTRYMQSIISDRDSFIKNELVDVIANVMHTMPPKVFIEVLEYCSTNYRQMGAVEIDELVVTTLTHSFAYLNNNRTLLKDTNDIAALISRLRGVYMSSRSNEVELIEMRKKAESIIKKATKVKNDNVIASLRTALLLYIILRSFSKNYYSA